MTTAGDLAGAAPDPSAEAREHRVPGRWFIDLLADLVRPDWHADAACREHPEITWFPSRGESLEPARQVCAGCLVHQECAQAGLDERFGIWAGRSERERRKIRSSGYKGNDAA